MRVEKVARSIFQSCGKSSSLRAVKSKCKVQYSIHVELTLYSNLHRNFMHCGYCQFVIYLVSVHSSAHLTV